MSNATALFLVLFLATCGQPQEAIASVYADSFQGELTRLETVFDQDGFTFACNDLFGKHFPDGQRYMICTTDPVQAYWPQFGGDGLFELNIPQRCITAVWNDTGALDGYSSVDLSRAAFVALFGKPSVGLGKVLVYDVKGGNR